MENPAYSKYFDQTDGSGTKIGGYAFMDKNSFDENNSKAELLFQLDMEGDAQKTYAMIADSGTLQFFIERDSLIALIGLVSHQLRVFFHKEFSLRNIPSTAHLTNYY